MNAPGGKKMLAFGLWAAAGCLAAWAVGEGLLRATAPAADEPTASLVQRPDLPEPPPAVADRPPPPAAPGAVPPAAPPPPPPPEMRARLEEARAHSGDVQLSLVWHNHNDLDLHCVDPEGEEVFYQQKKVPSGGWLDVDRNAGRMTTNRPVENIFWPAGKAPRGEYRVYVHHYARKPGGTDPTLYQVRVQVGGGVRLFDGQISHGQPKRLIHTFRVPAPDLRLGVPDVVEVNQGGSNRLGVKIARENLAGPVRLRFRLAAGVSIADVEVLAERDLVEVEARAAANVPAGLVEGRVEAASGDVQATSPIRVRVRAVPPSLRMAVPAVVDVPAGGENRLTVRIRRDRFRGPVRLRAETPAGLTVEGKTIPGESTEGELILRADAGAEASGSEIRVHAAADGAQADGALRVRILLAPSAPRRWSWRELARIAGWTAVLAMGLAAALVLAQNYFLGRQLIGPGLMAVLLGALLAGGVAGGVGQALFGMLAEARVEPMLGFVAGWLLLGALLGRGVGLVIPNLDGRKAAVAGAVGGTAAAVLFLFASRLGGAVAGRLCGSVLLGFSIGLMAALVEMAFRKVWLEVSYGPREVVTVNLGPEPVKVGGDRQACTVCARGAAPVALRFWLREGKVYCEDVPAQVTTEAVIDQTIAVGSVRLTVRSAEAAPAALERTVSTSVRPAPVGVNVPPARGDLCPLCGTFVPFQPGRRECMRCGHIL